MNGSVGGLRTALTGRSTTLAETSSHEFSLYRISLFQFEEACSLSRACEMKFRAMRYLDHLCATQADRQ